MKIEVLTTPGCNNCHVLEKMLDDLNALYTVVDVTEFPDYLKKFPIFTAPGLVINDTLAHVGIPKKHELENILAKFK